jgi:hypothetical protein
MHVLLDETFHNYLLLIELSQVKGHFTVFIFPSSLETLKYYQVEKWLKLNNKPKTPKQEEQKKILLL